MLINSTIQHLDWRSVWSGNSRIREGLSNLARLIRSFPQSARVVFLTDGEEAPRLHTFNTRDLSQFQGETDWLMVGIGSEEGSAIPKYDSENQLIGFWSVDSFALQPGIAQISESNIGARNDSIAFSESDRYISKLNEKYLIEITSMIKGQYVKGDSVNSVVSKMNMIPPSWRDKSELPLRNLFVTLSLIFFLLRFNKLLSTISFLKKNKKTIA